MRSHVLLSFALLLPVGATTIVTAADGRGCVGPICCVGTTKQLFIDDHVIDRMVGLQRVLNQPRRHPENPILVPEHPWEGRILETPIVLWDGQKELFHMYYWAFHSEKIFNCYARSKDAVHWEKPMLGLYEGPDGTKNNNIVLRGEGNCARMRYVALNPYSDDPEKRFVTMHLDGFVSLEAKDRPGILVTRPFELTGGTLELNVEAPDGEVVVEILDQKSTPIVGFTGKDAEVLRGVDSLGLQPAWNRGKLASMVGKIVRVKIMLTRGKLYALQVKP